MSVLCGVHVCTFPHKHTHTNTLEHAHTHRSIYTLTSRQHKGREALLFVCQDHPQAAQTWLPRDSLNFPALLNFSQLACDPPRAHCLLRYHGSTFCSCNLNDVDLTVYVGEIKLNCRKPAGYPKKGLSRVLPPPPQEYLCNILC